MRSGIGDLRRKLNRPGFAGEPLVWEKNLHGVEPREAERRGRLDEESFRQELRRLYADLAISVAEIERKLDVSKTARLRLRRKLGIQPRDANTRMRGA